MEIKIFGKVIGKCGSVGDSLGSDMGHTLVELYEFSPSEEFKDVFPESDSAVISHWDGTITFYDFDEGEFIENKVVNLDFSIKN